LGLTEAAEWNRARNPTTAWAKHYADEAALETVLGFIEASQAEEGKRNFREKLTRWIAVGVAIIFAVLAYVIWRASAETQRLGTISLARQLAAQSELVQSEQIVDMEPAALLATESMLRLPG